VHQDAGGFQLDLWRRLGVEVPATESGTTIACLEKAFAIAGEPLRRAFAGDGVNDVMGDDLTLVVGEDSGFGQRLADRGEHDAGDIADREYAGKFRCQRFAINRHPAAFATHAGIAHEFRNGLATIHGYARLLNLDNLTPEYRPYVQGIRDETVALGQVVTNFLNFARPTELVVGPVDMRAIAERVADEIRGDVRARGGDVTVRGKFGNVDGDEVLLRQAFSNLCRNALEACVPSGVAPVIALEGERDDRHGLLRIAVIDNGPGIDASVTELLFRPFFTTKAHGTGLGLALVQKIIVTHNGRVSVDSAAGGGARFVVTLPLRAA